MAEPLVYLRNGIPTRAVFMDASLLHEEIDKVFLLSAYLAEVMQKVPHVNVEVVFDALDNGTFPYLGDVVVDAWGVRLVVRER